MGSRIYGENRAVQESFFGGAAGCVQDEICCGFAGKARGSTY